MSRRFVVVRVCGAHGWGHERRTAVHARSTRQRHRGGRSGDPNGRLRCALPADCLFRVHSGPMPIESQRAHTPSDEQTAPFVSQRSRTPVPVRVRVRARVEGRARIQTNEKDRKSRVLGKICDVIYGSSEMHTSAPQYTEITPGIECRFVILNHVADVHGGSPSGLLSSRSRLGLPLRASPAAAGTGRKRWIDAATGHVSSPCSLSDERNILSW